MTQDSPPVRDLLADVRRARAVSAVSLMWTLLTSAAVLVLGLTADSLVLVAFGATGALDAAGSAALVVHFRHTLRHEMASERHERFALNVVTVGLFLLGFATAAESVHRLTTGERSTGTLAGVVLAALSSLALALLARAKHRIAARVASPALHADGWVSAVGSALAVVTLLGAVLSQAVQWTWADPSAATMVAAGAILLSVQLRLAARRTRTSAA